MSRTAYTRLRGAGKPPKLALVACMRRLIIVLNAMIKARSPWQDQLTATTVA